MAVENGKVLFLLAGEQTTIWPIPDFAARLRLPESFVNSIP